MLVGLSIRDIVLIDKLDLEFESGLGVLTGETGAGKSILLDSLGLVTGARADSRLVRTGADQASVTADFDLPAAHPVFALLAEQGLESDGGALILRRTLSADGRSRAWINDQPVSIGLLRDIGEGLVEVHGQHGEQGLLDPGSHRALLDDWAGLTDLRGEVGAAYEAMAEAEAAYQKAKSEIEAARADEDYLRHNYEELLALDPKPGETEDLEAQRQLGMHSEQLAEEMAAAREALEGDEGAEALLGRARARLARVADKAGGRLDEALAAMERAGAELGESLAALDNLGNTLDFDPARQEEIEERFFALKDAARKHGAAIDDLPGVRDDLARQIEALDSSDAHLGDLEKKAAAAREDYRKKAERLSEKRQAAAGELDRAVMAELPPLKLEKARFRTRIDRLEEQDWGPAGCDRASFEIATVPQAPFGPLSRIASGGELSRIVLALKVVLAAQGTAPTLIFDEVDRGVGGAVADAVGERLAKLAEDSQVLVVTHSPQVAARGANHWRVEKLEEAGGESMRTRVAKLDPDARREEIARMLAGATVTDEARAAAESLMKGAAE